MIHCLNLKAWHARALAAGASQLWVPCRLATDLARNHDGIRVRKASDGTFTFSRRAMHTPTVRESFVLDCPYPPGCVVVGRETWWGVRKGDVLKPGLVAEYDDVCYRADQEVYYFTHNHWYSPARMPLWAARWRLPVLSCRPVRVCQISEADARACGITDHEAAAYACHGHQRVFGALWLSDHGTRYPWATAWAWAITVSREVKS